MSSSSIWDPAPGAPREGSTSTRPSFDGTGSPTMGTIGQNASSASPQNPSPLHQRKDDHAHRKRNRIVLSCVQCRRRKLKCDRQFPCGACTRRGAADECYYQRHDKGQIEDSGVLERRMETLEKLVRGLVGETALQQIKEGSFDLNQDHSISSGDETVLLGRTTTGNENAPETLDNLNLAMGQLTILPEGEGGTLYAGGTAWDSVFAQFAELKQLLKQARDQGGGNLPENPTHMTAYTDQASQVSYLPSESFHSQADDEIVGAHQLTNCFPFNNCPPPSMAEVRLLLPSKPLMQKLVEKFFSSLLPFNKIVHYQTFTKEFEEFKRSPADAKPGWIALLFTMLSSSAMSYSPTVFATMNDTDLSHEQTARKFQNGAKAALVHAQFLRSHTLPVIQALILLQLSVNPDDMAVSSWALHGATKNLALQMGLHREPSLFKIPEPEAEIRRRVWWCIYIQDRLSCVNHGIAVSWQDSDADCREPLIVNDDQLTPDLAEKRHTYPTGRDAPFCPMTLFYCQMNLAKILTHVIQIAFGLKRTNYSKIMKLDEEVESFRRNILPRVLIPDLPGFDTNLEPLSMIMRCFYLKAILLLHRPFIGRAHENAQFKWSRDRAVQAGLTIVRNSIHLFTTSNVLLENHFAANPMLAHGLFPAPVALALDLYTWPDQPNPEPSRQALIDLRRVYLQLAATFAPVKRLYKILNVLMGKAWEKAALTCPPEDEASRMGSVSSSSLSTPSPTMANYDSGKKWGPQGLVPTSLQQLHSTDPYTANFDWTAQTPQAILQNNTMMPPGSTTTQPITWDPSPFPLFGSDSSSSQYTATPQINETFDLENTTGAWNQNEWDVFVNSMDLDPVVNGTSFI